MTKAKDDFKNRNLIKSFNSKSKYVITKLTQILGYTRQTIKKRFDDLTIEKIISNFTININPNILPINLKYVLLEIKTNPNEPQLLENLLKISQLKILDGILGEYSLFALLIFYSSEEYY
ncbi:unnamed protein product, partial [marine sediment metagenome]